MARTVILAHSCIKQWKLKMVEFDTFSLFVKLDYVELYSTYMEQIMYTMLFWTLTLYVRDKGNCFP